MGLNEAELEICDHTAVFFGDYPDCVYDHSQVILRGPNDDYFYAKYPERLDRDEIDIKKLNIVRIPPEHIWPLADPKFTQAPEPLPATCYHKRPNLLAYQGAEDDHDFLPTTILNEAEACELLRKHPHPNIARYLGCVVRDGRIKGLGFEKYPITLDKILEDGTPFDKDQCMRGIEAGVQHMHDLGLVHNDLNPANIMIDGGNPVIIDFDSCKPEGEELMKGGTFEWSTDETHSKRSNDHYSLSKIREAIFESVKKSEESQEVEEGPKVEENRTAKRSHEDSDDEEREDPEGDDGDTPRARSTKRIKKA
ncbi:kinase-like domain-containing protein [Xylaria curta]|nr:kinase-like domain-containing protein [Xylaria curta]